MHLDPGFIGSLVGFILMLIGGSSDTGRPSPGQSVPESGTMTQNRGAHDSEFVYDEPGSDFNGPDEEWGQETEDNNEFHRNYVANNINMG